jgi:hypothetical protein
MRTTTRQGDITENIHGARLDLELHALLQDEQSRQDLRAALITRWFGDRGQAVWSVVNA